MACEALRTASLPAAVDGAKDTMEDASDFLFNYWAGNDSDAWIDAMRSCDGGGTANAANAAFLTALKGAGMRYGPAIKLY